MKFYLNLIKKIKATKNPAKLFYILIIIGICWELFIFYSFPKQSWIDGLLESWYMSKGLVIYKDFTSQYFPILYMFMIPFHRIFGFIQAPTIYLFPVMSISLFFIVSIFSFKWLRGYYRCIPLLFYLFWNPVLAENHFTTTMYQNFMNFIAFVSWWSWYKNPRKITAIFLGLALSLSLLSSQVVSIFVAVISLSVLFRVFFKKEYLISGVVYGLAFLMPVILVIFWLNEKGAWEAFYYWNISYYISGSGYPYAMGRGLENVLIYFAVFSPLLIILYSILFKIWSSKEKSRISNNRHLFSQQIFWLLILLSFPIPFWFAIFHPNRFLMSMSLYGLSLGLGIQKIADIKNKVIVLFFIGLIVIITGFSVYGGIFNKYKRNLSYSQQRNILTKTYEDDPMFKVTQWLKINTPENAKLLATTDSLIYLESDRLPVNSRGATNLPFVYRPIDQFNKEIQSNPPDYWIIDERNWKRFHDFGYDDVTEYLQQILKCEPVVAKMEYVTIRKHSGQNICL